MHSGLPQAAWLVSSGVGLDPRALTPAPLGPPNASSRLAAAGQGLGGGRPNGTPRLTTDHPFRCPRPRPRASTMRKRRGR